MRERNWNKQSGEEKRLNRVTTVVVLCSGAEKERKVPTLVQFSASALGPRQQQQMRAPSHITCCRCRRWASERPAPNNVPTAMQGEAQQWAISNLSSTVSPACVSLHSHDHVTLSLCSPILFQQQSGGSSLQRQAQPAHTLLLSPRTMVRSVHRYPRELVKQGAVSKTGD